MTPFRVGEKITCIKAGDEMNLRDGETYTVYAILRRADGQPPGWAVQLVETQPHCDADGEVFDSFDPRRFRRAELPKEITQTLEAFAK